MIPPSEFVHEPVLAEEAAAAILAGSPARVVDGTVGLGGHARELLQRSRQLYLLGIDLDGELLAQARKNLASFGDRVCLRQGSYARIKELMAEVGWERTDGVLLDLGVCSSHVDRADRGFSFFKEAELDLRFSREEGETAAELVDRLPEKELADVIFRYGEEPASRRIARALKAEKPRTTTHFADVVAREVERGRRGLRKGFHPATRTFQALRIAVNHELEHLERLLRRFPRVLAPGGVLAVISYHSLEDRPVKERFAALAADNAGKPATPGPVRPGAEEKKRNKRSRSAKMRVFRLA